MAALPGQVQFFVFDISLPRARVDIGGYSTSEYWESVVVGAFAL